MVLSRENGDQAPVPPYWEEAKAELMKRDRIMNRLIPQFGDLHLVGHDDPFITLARAIVNQQVTTQVANTAWAKLLETCPKFTPAAVQKAGAPALAGCGLSKRKAEYILDLADHFKNKKVHAAQWAQMDDEAVIAELVQIRGITRWTA
jgi:DNA-3-methyladenine glycosylase II